MSTARVIHWLTLLVAFAVLIIGSALHGHAIVVGVLFWAILIAGWLVTPRE